MYAEAIPLLRTKLDVPPPRSYTLARERLLALIPHAPGMRLLLLSAPAGFGKTTLLATWCHTLAAQGGTAVAWLALEESDNDPARFLAYLVASLEQALAPERLEGVELAPSELGGAASEIALTQLVNALAAIDRDVVMLLDDYHLINAPAVHAAVAFLLEHMPKRACLAIGSRADPPLPLARLRAREQLIELRAADLRFTPDEVQRFLAASDLALTPDEAQAIGAYVEGWPAGIQLIALALRAALREQAVAVECVPSEPLSGQVLGRLDGSLQHVFAYLADDVFERQPAHRKAFLLQTAILDRMCAPLCDEVLGLSPNEQPKAKAEQAFDSSETASALAHPLSPGRHRPSPDAYSRLILEELEHTNVFVVPLDGERRWYRYHHLFRAFLAARLERESPFVVAELHRRASAWYQQNQLFDHAVEHALAAGDLGRAAALIESSAIAFIARGEYATLHRWLDQIPERIVAARPALCLWSAWAALLSGEVARIEPHLQRAERAWQAARNQHGLGQAALLRAQLAWLRHDAAQTIAAAQQALANLATQELALRAGSMLALGAGQLLAGDLVAASVTLAEASAQCQPHNNLDMLVAFRCLGDLAAQRGQLHAAAAKYQEVIDLVGRRAIWQGWVAAIRLGDLAREHNDLDLALEILQPALIAAEQAGVAVYLLDGQIALARTHQARGDRTAAMLALDQALGTARQLGSPAYTQRVCAEQARLALAQGDCGLAQRWQLEVALDLGAQLDTTCETEALILVRVLMEPWRQAPGDPALHTAHTILARLREDAAAHGRTGSLIEILALIALVDAAMGQRDQALAELQQALLLAMPEGYARIFLDEGAPMRLLLADCRWQIAQSNHGTNRENSQLLLAYVERLLAAFPTSTSCSSSQPAISDRQSAALVEPLSERELEVLRLIAGGASNQAIAAALVISIGTVKSHINHILGKLAACNRTEAVSLGRALGLLAEKYPN